MVVVVGRQVLAVFNQDFTGTEKGIRGRIEKDRQVTYSTWCVGVVEFLTIIITIFIIRPID